MINTRARDSGLELPGLTGVLNSITDVPGLSVGHSTIIQEEINTGVTAICPRGNQDISPVLAAYFSLNGNGELTGSHWIDEMGSIEGPILLTNTCSVGVVRDAVIDWSYQKFPQQPVLLPVVAETYDGVLNDIGSFSITKEHVFQALNQACGGPVDEGNIGGGTGMICHDFKGGIGTASRLVEIDEQAYTIGVLVQANYGRRDLLTIRGCSVGKYINDLMPDIHYQPLRDGSIIIVIATDAPLLPFQLKALAKRATLGLAKMGSIASYSSGDIFLAFSTQPILSQGHQHKFYSIRGEKLNPVYQAVVESTEESIINALLAAKTMTGFKGNTVHALPHERLLQLLKTSA